MNIDHPTLIPADWIKQAMASQKARKAAAKPKEADGQYCRNCAHFQHHTYSESINYCRKGKSSHTPNGFAKAKRLGWCSLWQANSQPK